MARESPAVCFFFCPHRETKHRPDPPVKDAALVQVGDFTRGSVSVWLPCLLLAGWAWTCLALAVRTGRWTCTPGGLQRQRWSLHKGQRKAKMKQFQVAKELWKVFENHCIGYEIVKNKFNRFLVKCRLCGHVFLNISWSTKAGISYLFPKYRVVYFFGVKTPSLTCCLYAKQIFNMFVNSKITLSWQWPWMSVDLKLPQNTHTLTGEW